MSGDKEPRTVPRTAANLEAEPRSLSLTERMGRAANMACQRIFWGNLKKLLQKRQYEDVVWFKNAKVATDHLCEFWSSVPVVDSRTRQRYRPEVAIYPRLYKVDRPSKARPRRHEVSEWTIGITPTFRKSIATVDKKLQGRILEALTELSQIPLKIRGDTVKPLEGDLKGLWRYRIGDYRLIYSADSSAHLVVLVEWQARGAAYA